MDPSNGTTSLPQAQPPRSSLQRGSGNSSRGGSRGGRGARNNVRDPATQDANARGGRRGGRGQGRQRGGVDSDGRTVPSNERTRATAPDKPPLASSEARGASGVRPTEDSQNLQGDGAEGGEVEAEVCFICASPVLHQSVAPCNHRTCHICALRLRALYKTRACAHCRSEAKFVIFTDDPDKRFEDFVDGDFEKTDDVLGIKYEKKEIHDDTILLLRYNCPEESCDVACLGWPDLHRHVRSVHHKVMCDLCTRNKKVFTHEHELYTRDELRKHEKFGDDNPGAVDQSGFKGHPECGFCRMRFYGDDELYAHCRDKHEKCHICERRNSGRQHQQYYIDYNSLEEHFRKDHFLCLDRECLEKKFVVFESEMDMKAHQLESHPNDMSKDVRRDARRVDISSFDYRTPHQENRGGGRSGRGRGRDPHAEPIPASSAQPLRRDELAYQRQMAVQSAQSIAPRTFGDQLTRPQEPAAPAPAARTNNSASHPSLPAVDQLHVTPNDTRPSSSENLSALNFQAHSLSPQDAARRLQHAAVMERAQSMLKNDTTKTADFRARVSSYRASAITASELIDSFFTLFDVPSADLGKLVKELADIYENEAKRLELLKAWNDWRAINEDYPSLPGPTAGGASALGSTGGGGRRILKLKSSTAQSSRSAVSRQAGWGTASSSSSPFPAMPVPAAAAATSSASANRAGAGRVGPVPWATRSRSPLPSSPAPRSPAIGPTMPTTSGAAPRSVLGSSSAAVRDAFPALPAAAKPNTHIFGLHRGTVRWDDSRGAATPANPWGGPVGSAGNSTSNSAQASEGEGSGGAGGKKKGKQGKKTTLYKFG